VARPLTCDGCSNIIQSPVSPIKVAVNGTVPDELKDLSHDELSAAISLGRQLGQTLVPQSLLDFCSWNCVMIYSTTRWGSALLEQETRC